MAFDAAAEDALSPQSLIAGEPMPMPCPPPTPPDESSPGIMVPQSSEEPVERGPGGTVPPLPSWAFVLRHLARAF